MVHRNGQTEINSIFHFQFQFTDMNVLLCMLTTAVMENIKTEIIYEIRQINGSSDVKV